MPGVLLCARACRAGGVGSALTWAAEAKKMGQAETSSKGGPLVESST